MLRVVFFGAQEELSYRALQAVAKKHRVVGVIAVRKAPVATASQPNLLRKAVSRFLRSSRDSLVTAVTSAGARLVEIASPHAQELTDILRDMRPDLICSAAFPRLLPKAVYGLPALGAINLHGSLLPRHRGILPLFWIYYHNDREAGVTVHHIDDGADTGDILDQVRYDLPRGLAVDQLNEWNTARGADLLAHVVDELEAGRARGRPQRHEDATHAPRITPGSRMVEFEEWDVERVWHFLHGIERRYREPLRDPDHRLVEYRTVSGYERAHHGNAPGTVELGKRSTRLYCRDGWLTLDGAAVNEVAT